MRARRQSVSGEHAPILPVAELPGNVKASNKKTNQTESIEMISRKEKVFALYADPNA